MVRRYSATYGSAQAAERHAAFSPGDGMLVGPGAEGAAHTTVVPEQGGGGGRVRVPSSAPGGLTNAERIRRPGPSAGARTRGRRPAAAFAAPHPARSATRVSIRRSSPPGPRPRSSSRAGAGSTTRSGPTAPSTTARPPQKRWRSDLPTPPPGQTGGSQHELQHWHNNRGQVITRLAKGPRPFLWELASREHVVGDPRASIRAVRERDPAPHRERHRRNL